MDLQVSREIKAAALQAIRYVQLLTLSQIIPTITIKMINIIAGKNTTPEEERSKYMPSPSRSKFLSPTQ
jgi:hypothetical protein